LHRSNLFLAAVVVTFVALVLGACQPIVLPTPVPAPTEVPVTAALQAQADQAAGNKEVMHEFIRLFQTGNWDDFHQVVATDCVLHYPGGEDVAGLDAMAANWKVFFAKLKDLRAATHAEISEGDILIDFLTFEATYEGEYMGKQIAGVPIKYNQVEMVRISDGKIVEWWVEQDRLWMAQQLGMELAW
jgi:predicted ester cyclase